jgi:hypothetical protein
LRLGLRQPVRNGGVHRTGPRPYTHLRKTFRVDIDKENVS